LILPEKLTIIDCGKAHALRGEAQSLCDWKGSASLGAWFGLLLAWGSFGDLGGGGIFGTDFTDFCLGIRLVVFVVISVCYNVCGLDHGFC